MAKTISNLSTILSANVQPFVRAFASTKPAIQSFTGSIASVGSTMLKLTGVAAVVGAAIGVLGSAKDSISLASTLEQNSVAFETMLGSAEKAGTLMQQLQGFAASTPFEFPELAGSAKSLLAFGVSADQILPSLKAIGDISSGIGAPVSDIAEIFGKAKTAGTLFAEDINQLVGRGIPVIQQFAKQLGVPEGEIKKLASEGRISFGMLQQAFVDLTSNGGQFAGMMEKQSATLGGLWSTLTDNVSMTLAGLVTTIVDAFNLKAGLTALTNGIGTAGSYLTSAVKAWAPVIVGFASGVWQTITTAFTNIYNTVAPVVASIVNWVNSNFLSLVTTATGYWMSIYSLITTVATGVWTVVTTVAGGIATAWTTAMAWLGVSTAQTGTGVGDVFATMAGAWQWTVQAVTLGINVLTYGLQNIGTVAAYVLTGMAAGVVRCGNQIAYVFTDVLPATLSWFGRNFTTILTDVAAFYGTVLTNMLTNAANFGAALWSAIKGEGFNFQFTGLTERFKSSLAELPQIAERQIGGLEATLQGEYGALGKSLYSGLADHLADADRGAAAAAKGMVDSLTNGMPSITPPQIKPPTLDTMQVDKATGQMKAGLDGVKQSAEATAEALKATVAGSAEAMASRASAATDAMLAEARAGQTAAPSTAVASRAPDVRSTGNTAKQTSTMEQVAALLAQIKAEAVKIAKNTDGPLAEVAL